MKFGHIELRVSNPVASMDFYVNKLGFKLEANQGDKFIWVRSGATTILLRPGKPKAREFDETHNICLYVSSLEKTANELKSRGVELSKHESCYHFRDPDGHWYQLANPNDDHSVDAGKSN